MTSSRRSARSTPLQALGAVLLAGFGLAGCAGGGASFQLPSFGSSDPSPPPPSGPLPPPSLRSEDIVGRWGLASFQRPEDRARTEAAARGQCKQPYVISRSGGGVMMLGHDNPQLQDMTIKANVEGKTFIGPGPESGLDDREVVSFDGRVLLLRWVDPEVAGRYGTMILVRCSPRA